MGVWALLCLVSFFCQLIWRPFTFLIGGKGKPNYSLPVALFIIRFHSFNAMHRLRRAKEFNFTIKRGVSSEDTVSVNYDDFTNDVEVGDTLLVDGGMMSLVVK
ncbi:uncharacterized protein LOC131219492 [Magnolia sinica]|uniref:uncharacterized protein LOC131219492 n=1 Tax=Magnolia sinica TaxID=86752 RepID=UPI00265A0A7D|nr:uncharacterized protein LOC131219492 [Magnolia sinica]